MTYLRFLGAGTFVAMFSLLAGTGAGLAQDKTDQPGCTTSNGASTGAGCTDSKGSAAGAVENGMPATKHQGEVMRTDDEAAQGENMNATGAGGAQLPATQHQQEVLQKPGTTPGKAGSQGTSDGQ